MYLPNDEPEPERHCKSKRYIGKIMFLCAVARPVFYLMGRGGMGKLAFGHSLSRLLPSVRVSTGSKVPLKQSLSMSIEPYTKILC